MKKELWVVISNDWIECNEDDREIDIALFYDNYEDALKEFEREYPVGYVALAKVVKMKGKIKDVVE